MDAQAIHTEVGQNPEAIPSAKDRWGTDSVGRIYYPFGPAFRGYRVLDAAAEAQIRAADEQYERSGLRFVRSVSSASTIGLLFLLGLIFELHPVLAVTFFFVAIIIIVGATAAFRFRAVRSCLLGMATTPANSDSRQRLIETLGMAVSTVFVFWAALVLYDVRLTALIPDHPGELRFYPTIAGNLVFVAMGLPFLFTAIVHFDHLASKIGQNQTTLALVLFSLLQVAASCYHRFQIRCPHASHHCRRTLAYMWLEAQLERNDRRGSGR